MLPFSPCQKLGASSRAVRVLLLLCVLVLCVWGHMAHADTTQQTHAEKRLVEILALIEHRKINEAFRAVSELTEEVPNFRAAQLLYADMLRMRSGETPMGEQLARSQTEPSKRNMGVADQDIAPPEFYQGLHNEIQRRRQATIDLPPPGKVPSNLMHLGTSVRHVLAVDTSKSRLYVFASGLKGLELIGNFYVTIGRNGVHKRLEGDQRTPLGVYFVGRQIPRERLPDLYGQGALTVNYPNDWDRLHGRTGSGIWLHGVPSDQFSRVPQASDGCVVLSNPDIAYLMALIDRRTPVLITEKLDWVAPQWLMQQNQKDGFKNEIERWQAAWRQGNTQSLGNLYSRDLASPETLDKRRARMGSLGPLSQLTVQDMSIYQWKEEAGEVRIVNLHVAKNASTTVRQYWRKQDGRWQIFAEDLLS